MHIDRESRPESHPSHMFQTRERPQFRGSAVLDAPLYVTTRSHHQSDGIVPTGATQDHDFVVRSIARIGFASIQSAINRKTIESEFGFAKRCAV